MITNSNLAFFLFCLFLRQCHCNYVDVFATEEMKSGTDSILIVANYTGIFCKKEIF